MQQLTEDRMKELSANDLDVWVYDTKRNSSVQRGRQEQVTSIVSSSKT